MASSNAKVDERVEAKFLELAKDLLGRLDEIEYRLDNLATPAPQPAPAPKPAERGYVAPKIVRPDTIAALREGDRDLVLDVKVEVVNAKFAFTKKDGNQGFGQRIIVSDHTAQIALVLWNEQTDLADNLRPGDYITLHKVYTKRSPKGALELQLDRQGSISAKEQVIL